MPRVKQPKEDPKVTLLKLLGPLEGQALQCKSSPNALKILHVCQSCIWQSFITDVDDSCLERYLTARGNNPKWVMCLWDSTPKVSAKTLSTVGAHLHMNQLHVVTYLFLQEGCAYAEGHSQVAWRIRNWWVTVLFYSWRFTWGWKSLSIRESLWGCRQFQAGWLSDRPEKRKLLYQWATWKWKTNPGADSLLRQSKREKVVWISQWGVEIFEKIEKRVGFVEG